MLVCVYGGNYEILPLLAGHHMRGRAEGPLEIYNKIGKSLLIYKCKFPQPST